MPTMYLRKSAPGPVSVRRGAWSATLEPGGYADVADDLVGTLETLGAKRRNRPAGDDAGDEPTEE